MAHGTGCAKGTKAKGPKAQIGAGAFQGLGVEVLSTYGPEATPYDITAGKMINVESTSENTFLVTVTDETETTHEVHVQPSYWEEITAGNVSMETLVERSFEFLLEREPNTSILPSFDLSSITRYFPEYESDIKKRL